MPEGSGNVVDRPIIVCREASGGEWLDNPMEIGDNHQQGPEGDGRQYDPSGENSAFPHLR